MIVFADQLLDAARDMDTRGSAKAELANGVVVTPAQLRKAGEILRDGPQPIANGIQSHMPAFIEPGSQSGESLVLQVGILPSRVYTIDARGNAQAAECL